jgi:hypothetical protein
MKYLSTFLLILILMFGGCAKQSSSITPNTDKSLPANLVEIQIAAYFPGRNVGAWAFTPDKSYALVNRKWIKSFYNEWREDLFKKGVIRWDDKFDCNKFAASFCAAAQIAYFNSSYGDSSKPQALAIGEIWYYPAYNQRPHAIVCAIADDGVIFLEPQTGEELKLLPIELSSIFFKRF